MKRRDAAARIAWTAGCLLYLAHVAAAFEYRHHWSHTAAYESTAQQTADVFGVDWGGGLYFNYVFTILWIADVFWWWRAGLDRYCARRRSLHLAVQIFFAFMFFNGAIVFGSPLMLWLGSASILILIVIAASRSRNFGARSSPV